MRVRVALLAFVAGVALAAAPAAADQTYILTAARWGKAQTDAVVAAGGTVTFSHQATGIAIATSDAPDFLARVLADKAVRTGEPDVMVTLPDIPIYDLAPAGIEDDEPFFAPLQWAPKAVNAPAAWASGCTGDGVRVAIVDGGLFLHPDFARPGGYNIDSAHSTSFVPNPAIPGSFIRFTQDVGPFWHGTHVAGIVAAGDNGVGMIGIAPEATIIGVKVLHGGGGFPSWILRGILYAATPIGEGGGGADIINLSLGTELFSKAGGNGYLKAVFNSAVNYASSRGVLVVVAAGNDGKNLDHLGPVTTVPADSANELTVSATGPVGFAYDSTTNLRRPASYSNYGNSLVEVAAPGGDNVYPGDEFCTLGPATGPCRAFDGVVSTNVPTAAGNYAFASGTSMAAPVVSAIAALAIQSHPGISLGKLKTLIQRAADDEGDKGHDNFYGHGFANAYAACTAR